MGLNHNCTKHFNNWKAYKLFFALGSSVAPIGSRPIFGTNVTKFNTDYATAVGVSNRANAILAGITKSQIKDKRTAAHGVGGITANIHSYAIDHNHLELKLQMEKRTEGYIFQYKNEDFSSSCNLILDDAAALLISDPIAGDYYDAADIAAARLKVTTFHDDIGGYINALNDINNAKIEFETTIIDLMTADLDSLQGLLSGVITTTYKPFADNFISLREVSNVGKRDQGVILDLMKDEVTGDPIVMDGNMTILQPPYPVTKKPKTKNTNSNGAIPLMNLKIGTWQITFTAPGYHPQTITIKVTSKHVIHLTIHMVHI